MHIYIPCRRYPYFYSIMDIHIPTPKKVLFNNGYEPKINFVPLIRDFHEICMRDG